MKAHEQEREYLQTRAEDLLRQLERIIRRIRELEELRSGAGRGRDSVPER